MAHRGMYFKMMIFHSKLENYLKLKVKFIDIADFCHRLQRSQDKAARREKGEQVSSDDEDDLPPLRKKKGDDEADFIKHPFALKPTAPITINIPVRFFAICNCGPPPRN
ncbi:unnamed protein product [Gongylonema pulchrum]|uniref:PIPK domain-containing protein n=1 Tax=Gongylonema pulchrum TaxID=637853 RepID=A0A183DAZ4_9BILA|nr:unnamed protein product [Gongylonema pulchrum]